MGTLRGSHGGGGGNSGLVARVAEIGPLSRLRERVGVRGGQERTALITDPHPTLRATFSRKREKGFRVPKIDDSDD